ncbi:MAG TPA: hypothetical protein VN380_18870 [Thermoanaerobaculia bacterium]|jgi:hypothetical protein|nr:hypothetical protein [Thermoanaerobaculia bacterium]
MIFAVVQVVLSSIAGFAIFRLWRNIAASGRAVFWLVTIGLLVRAIGGVVAFWMSYLGLPIARSLQIGRGLWVFAIDATTYVQFALFYADKGLQAILLVDRSLPAPFFIQMLAGAMLCFGSVVSVAILLNLAAYLGCCAIVLSFGGATRRPAVFAIAVLSLSPSAVVWSLQPLKDVTFLFLVMAFFGAARVWQQTWKNESSRNQVVQGVIWSVILAGLMYGISGVRWYFGAVMLTAAVPFAVMSIIGARARFAAASVSLLLLALSLGAFLISAGPYIPRSIQNALRTQDVKQEAAVPKMVLTTMGESRRGFDRAGGATIIGAGSAIRKIDAAFAGKTTAPKRTSVPNIVRETPEHREAPTGASAPLLIASLIPAPNVVAAPAPGPSQFEPRPAARNAVAAVGPPPSPRLAQATTPRPERSAAPLRQSVQPAPSSPVRNVTSAAAPPPLPRPVNPLPLAPGVIPQPLPATVLPVSPIARILAGTAAMVLPHSLGQWLGIVDVRGGRSLWLFVEIDTIVFDMVLAFAIFSMAAAVRRRTLGAPVFWLALLVTGTIGLTLVYTVSNFGTLFRHRDMLLVGLVLLPLAAAAPAARLRNLPD